MWFRNLVVYRLSGPVPKADGFEEKLAKQPLQKVGGFEMESRGWTCPRADGEYLYRQGRHWMVSLGTEQKLLPMSVVRDAAQEKIDELEAKFGHPLGRKQKRDIRDQIHSELLPRALSRRRTTYAWIDTESGLLAIDAAGEPKAEQFMEVLRRIEDGLAAERLQTRVSPATAMARWILEGDAPGQFGIDQDLELRTPDASKATVRYSRHALEGRDIREHLAQGKQPVRLGLTWNDRISFVLTEELHVKRVQFLDVIEREAGEEVENEEERFEIDFALMTGELSKLMAELVKALGGEKADREGATTVEG